MKITVLNGTMPNYDYGLHRILKMTSEILLELGVTLNEINLSFAGIPLYDGISSKAVEDIMKGMADSSGIILASTAPLFAPSAIMQTFLEHLLLGYQNPLSGKNCFVIVISESGSERSALNYYSDVINHFGGYDSVRLGLDKKSVDSLDKDTAESAVLRTIIEKQVEDFYRMSRQNRQFVIPRGYSQVSVCEEKPAFTEDETEIIKQAEMKSKTPISELYKKLNLDAFDEKQEQDIAEISQYFASKLSSDNENTDRKVLIESFTPTSQPAKPRAKTCKQLSQSLPHYFQPQLAGGLTAVIQLIITGNENFDGFISIQNTECRYNEGQAESPDITILSDSEQWMEVLKYKCTAQKAFMIGRLKVRGNFVLLTKFDQLFKFGS